MNVTYDDFVAAIDAMDRNSPEARANAAVLRLAALGMRERDIDRFVDEMDCRSTDALQHGVLLRLLGARMSLLEIVTLDEATFSPTSATLRAKARPTITVHTRSRHGRKLDYRFEGRAGKDLARFIANAGGVLSAFDFEEIREATSEVAAIAERIGCRPKRARRPGSRWRVQRMARPKLRESLYHRAKERSWQPCGSGAPAGASDGKRAR